MALQPGQSAHPRAVPDELGLQDIDSSIPVALAYLDRTEHFRYANARYSSMFAKEPADLVGSSLFDALGDRAYRRAKRYVKRAMAGEAIRYENVLPDAGRGEIHVQAFYVPNIAVDGEVRGFFALVQDVTEQKAAESALQRAHDDLKNRDRERSSELADVHRRVLSLSARLLSAQEDERSRIARELHDDFSQRLAHLAINLGRLRGQGEAEHSGLPEAIADEIETLQSSAIELSADINRLSRKLHPAVLDHVGLAAAVTNLCNEISSPLALDIMFEQTGKLRDVPAETSLCLYRVAQEALSNVVKHSQATEAKVSLVLGQDEITLKVSDNGIGFDEKADAGKGLGLVSMRERLGLVDGTLNVARSKPCGTLIKARVPSRSGATVKMDRSSKG